MEEEAPIESEVTDLLRRIWTSATPDSIAADIRRAQQIASSAPPHEQEQAHAYLEAIRRLEVWLHDR